MNRGQSCYLYPSPRLTLEQRDDDKLFKKSSALCAEVIAGLRS